MTTRGITQRLVIQTETTSNTREIKIIKDELVIYQAIYENSKPSGGFVKVLPFAQNLVIQDIITEWLNQRWDDPFM